MDGGAILTGRFDDLRLEAVLKLHKMATSLGASCESMFAVSLWRWLFTELRGVMSGDSFLSGSPSNNVTRLLGIFRRFHHQSSNCNGLGLLV